eukprot:TRINITY_DN62889_c0_g1_i1.p1 TRINITY_DN62889_c0_g1~~TRINITY_DN62889_c0_g1_i1.p1  ORF type:complete len:379 (-),score=77.62 TRINITY_DN62889_c0_g1_i1:122-1258(-)
MMGRDDAVADRAYDEAIPVETDDEELSTPATSEEGSPTHERSQVEPHSRQQQQQPQRQPQHSPQKQPVVHGNQNAGSDSEDSSGSESTTSSSSEGGDKDDGKSSALPQNAYNPEDFKHLKVSAEVEELFAYITRYKPHTIELDTTLKPFIPELIPSIGEVDAFLKMPRPDKEPSGLGTVCLDEPALNPTDPSILDLQLRSLSKAQDLQPMEVRSIENAEKNPKEVENWVRRIEDLNRTKPAPIVQYSRRMPDIEQLMQVWPIEFEECLQENPLPEFAEMDLDLPSYIRILASILDVPVHAQLTETLHVIFTLYSEFKSNQHFSKTDTAGHFAQDPYNFGPVPNFAAHASGSGAMGTGQMLAGAHSESMAPSRVPSPAR